MFMLNLMTTRFTAKADASTAESYLFMLRVVMTLYFQNR